MDRHLAGDGLLLGVCGTEVHAVSGRVDEGEQVAGAREPGQEDGAAGDQIRLQTEVAHQVDGDRAGRLAGARVAGQDQGVHEHSVVLQADVPRVHREAHQVRSRLRVPDLHDPAEGEAALVDQGATGLDVGRLGRGPEGEVQRTRFSGQGLDQQARFRG